jgi:segregation and condensation protein B
MNFRQVKAAIEAILYVADETVTVEQLTGAFPDWDLGQIEVAMTDLMAAGRAEDRGVALREIAGGYRLFTKVEHHEAVRQFIRNRPGFKLSMAALETLAIIAYRQPVTAPEILHIRGVKSPGAIKTLLEKKLIVPRGRKKIVGVPMQYGTSKEFLVHFGLDSLRDLPSLEEFEEIFGEKADKFRQKSLFEMKTEGIAAGPDHELQPEDPVGGFVFEEE